MITIYALVCLENGKAYIGCTRGKVSKRFREHRCLLNQEQHSEPLLSVDWKLYGQNRFGITSVITLGEEADLDAMRGIEKFVMQQYKNRGLLYNLNETSFEPTRKAIEKAASMGVNRGRIHSAESNLKRRIAQLGIAKNNGAKISATKKLLGQKPSIEAARLGGIAVCKTRWGNK